MIYRLALSIAFSVIAWMSYANNLESSPIQYSYYDFHSKINEVYNIQFIHENSSVILNISMSPPNQFSFRGNVYRCQHQTTSRSALKLKVKTIAYHPDTQPHIIDDLIERLNDDTLDGYADAGNFALFFGKNTANLIFPLINPSLIPLIDCDKWNSNVKLSQTMNKDSSQVSQ
jgi:hypothetical protein